MNSDIPTLDEIIQLTRSELNAPQDDDDIIACGRACIALLATDPQTCLDVAYQQLHAVPYKDVHRCWRRLYVDAALRIALDILERQIHRPNDEKEENALSNLKGQKGKDESSDWLTPLVKTLDMSLILTGAPTREPLLELWFTALDAFLSPSPSSPSTPSLSSPPPKRRKLAPSTPLPLLSPPSSSFPSTSLPQSFPTHIHHHPTLTRPLPRLRAPSLPTFQSHIASADPTPLIITDAIQHWPALHDRPWRSPAYLLSRTLGGRRLVPVEIGRSYTDAGWGQRIVSMGEFLATYMADTPKKTETGTGTGTGYLAQHDLFAQIPALRRDIAVPDYCYADPAPLPSSFPPSASPKLDTPLLNAWFGPAHTISPLHTDPYHNVLAQVVGYKYVRVYAPGETGRMYPRGVEQGVDMGNTSGVDLDAAMGVWPDISCWRDSGENGAGEGGAGGRGRVGEGDGEEDDERRAFEERFPAFRDAVYVEGVLGPGECLYLPAGWWHYVRSLTPSFSVSFWFN